MSKFRVCIFGGRDFEAEPRHFEMVDYLLADWLDNPEDLVIVSGGARGADKVGEWWADFNKAHLEVWRADWEKHGKAAGFIRNQEMVDSGLDYAIQFPGGNGTADMRKRLDKAGVTVWESTT